MKNISAILFGLFVSLLVWGTWIATQKVVVWYVPDPAVYEIDVSMFDWMASVLPGAGALFFFTLISVLFLGFGYRWVFGNRGWLRILLLPVPSLILAAVIWVTIYGVINYHENKFYSHTGPGTEDSLGEDLMKKAAGIRTLVASVPFPSDPDSIHGKNLKGEVFDVSSFFTVLPNLSEKSGYELDYVHVGTANGFPILYARKKGETPYRTSREYIDSLLPGGWRPNGDYLQDWSPAIEMESTPEAFLELAALHLVGNQFYLYWHANYNDRVIIASPEKLEEIINVGIGYVRPMPIGYRMKARELDVRPVVEFMEEEPVVWVDLLTFTQWGGFILEKLAFNVEYPHKLLLRESETLIEYQCGICY